MNTNIVCQKILSLNLVKKYGQLIMNTNIVYRLIIPFRENKKLNENKHM